MAYLCALRRFVSTCGTSRNRGIRYQVFVFECIWRHLPLNLTEGTLDDVQVWP